MHNVKTAEKRGIRGGFGLMAAALLFLWNPHVNVIDVLPDCIGWLLAALSMTELAWAMDDFTYLRRRAWILCGITTAKLAPMVFSILGVKKLEFLGEPTMVLTYTVCFGAFEMFFGIQVIRGWIDAVSRFGLLHDSNVALYGTDREPQLSKMRKRLAAHPNRDIGTVHGRMTFWFFVWRFVSSFVPELVYLRSTEYLGNVVYGVVIDIRDYRPYLIMFFSFVAGVKGLRWLFRCIRQAVRLSQDQHFRSGLDTISIERHTQILTRATLERFHIAFGFFLVGGVFLCHFTFERINILPDCIGLLLILVGVYLLRHKLEIPGSFFPIGTLGVLVTVPYAVLRTWHSIVHHGFWTDNLVSYFKRDVPVSLEKQAYTMQLQLIMLGAAVLETVLLIWLFWRFLRVMRSLDRLNDGDGHTVYDSLTPQMMREEKEKYLHQPKKVFLWFCISAGFEVLRALPMFSFTITSIALVRLIINLVFLWVFAEYLSARRKSVEYHYTYHFNEDAEKEALHEQIR